MKYDLTKNEEVVRAMLDLTDQIARDIETLSFEDLFAKNMSVQHESALARTLADLYETSCNLLASGSTREKVALGLRRGGQEAKSQQLRKSSSPAALMDLLSKLAARES